MTHPIFKGLLFAAIPLIHYLLGMMNYSQAGKTGILGFFILTTLFYWKELFPTKNKIISSLIIFSSIILLAFTGFQMGLRDIFSVQQDNIIVIEAIFNTDAAESKEFLVQYSRQIIKHTLLFFVTTALFLFIVIKGLKQRIKSKKSIIAGVIFTLLTIIIHFNPTARRANPLFYFPIYYTKWNDELIATKELTKKLENNINLDSTAITFIPNTKRTLVWVIGESDTRNNWGLYGYARQTTPRLDKHKELLIFKNILSADSGTVGSVSKMLTPATLKQPDLWKEKPDVLSIAKTAGYKVFWLSNHGTDKRGVLSIYASHANKTVFTNKGTSRGESSFDSELFAPYSKALEDKADKKLIIVHIMGAHPAYNFRYPDKYNTYKTSTDDDVTKQLEKEGRSQYAIIFRNQYDNAILYQDYILSSLLEKLQEQKKQNTAWLYIADHGQDVSHNSDFSGHNHKAKEMWEVPMLLWKTDEYPSTSSTPSLSINYQADTIDHGILGLLGISGIYYNAEYDIFSSN